MVKDYKKFKDTMRWVESRDKYDIVNEYGYLGAYQFGKARLLDLGISIDNFGRFTHPILYARARKMTKLEFLNNKELQDQIFDIHIKDLVNRIRKNLSHYFGKIYRGILLTESGMVAGAHLVGYGGLKQWLNGKVVKDGFGTDIEKYLKLFQDYDLSDIGV